MPKDIEEGHPQQVLRLGLGENHLCESRRCGQGQLMAFVEVVQVEEFQWNCWQGSTTGGGGGAGGLGGGDPYALVVEAVVADMEAQEMLVTVLMQVMLEVEIKW
jgi:hypothetical protein